MYMYTIERSFDVAMGHRLSKHGGKCRNFHGHNYKIIVAIRSKQLDDNGMVLDFSELDKIVRKFLDTFDHALVVNSHDKVYNRMSDVLSENDIKIVSLPYEPTAENFATEIYHHVACQLSSNPNIQVDHVTVFENERSSATYNATGV